MALNTYSIVAIFVSILGFALILSITWLVYKWSSSSRSPLQTHGWPFSHSSGSNEAHFAQTGSPSHFPPTQRLMVQHGRVVPLRHSVAPSSRSGISSIRYSGWLASSQSVYPASSRGDAASVRSCGASHMSSHAGRRTPSIDLEAGGVSYTDIKDPAPDPSSACQSPISPNFPTPRVPPRLYSQLRSKRFRTPSLRSHRSSVPTITTDNLQSGSLMKNEHWSTIMEESSPSASGHTSTLNSRPVSTAFPKAAPARYPSPKQQERQLTTSEPDKRPRGSSPVDATNAKRRTRVFGAGFFDPADAPENSSRESLTAHSSDASESSPRVHVVPFVPAQSARAPMPHAMQNQVSRHPSPLQSKYHVSSASTPQRGSAASGTEGLRIGTDRSPMDVTAGAGAETANGASKDTKAAARSNTMCSEDSEMLSALPKSPGLGKFAFST